MQTRNSQSQSSKRRSLIDSPALTSIRLFRHAGIDEVMAFVFNRDVQKNFWANFSEFFIGKIREFLQNLKR